LSSTNSNFFDRRYFFQQKYMTADSILILYQQLMAGILAKV